MNVLLAARLCAFVRHGEAGNLETAHTLAARPAGRATPYFHRPGMPVAGGHGGRQ